MSFIFCLVVSLSVAQIKLTGVILNANSKTPISFTSVGLIGKSYGTVSDENGLFELLLKNENEKDSVRIASIGFKTKTFLVKNYLAEKIKTIYLEEESIELDEVVVNSTKIKYKELGAKNYSTKNCSGFVKNENNWRGSEASIIAGNKVGRFVLIENFKFYIIKNLYTDSLRFRLKFYEASEKKYPRYKLIMKKPVYFKLGIKNGEVEVKLKDYNITTDKDFFVSLECLEDEMDINKFCYAGSYDTPCFAKTAAFASWIRTRAGGADFKVKVSYSD